MGNNYLFFILILISYCSLAQTKVIDTTTCYKWPVIRNEKISNNGKYITYKTGQLDKFSELNEILTIQSFDGTWKKEVKVTDGACSFTEDSRWFIFKKSNDTIIVLNLLMGTEEYFYNISHEKFTLQGKSGMQWLAYKEKDDKHSLILLNLATNQKRRFPGVTDYLINDDGTSLIIQSIAVDKNKENSIFFINLNSESQNLKQLATDCRASNFTFNNQGAVAFIAEKHVDNSDRRALRYYQAGWDSSIILANEFTIGMNNMQICKKPISFDYKGAQLFFYLEEKTALQQKKVESSVDLDLWNYRDSIPNYSSRSFLVTVHLERKGSVVWLQTIGETPSIVVTNSDGSLLRQEGNQYILVKYDHKTSRKRPNIQNLPSYYDLYLVFTADGSKRLIKTNIDDVSTSGFSPSKKFVYWYEYDKKAWFTYNIATHVIRNISYQITTPIYFDTDRFKTHVGRPYFIAGWLENDKAVLIQDRYDILMTDPNGVSPTINVTKKLNRQNRLQFRIVNFSTEDTSCIRYMDTVIVSVFNFHNKQNGFFRLVLNENGASYLQKIMLKPKAYYFPSFNIQSLSGCPSEFRPIRAKQANAYLYKMMSPVEYPNLFFTNNFSNITQLTNLAPQEQYRWYTTQLIKWKSGGKNLEGILYKPSGFSSKKKYPLIFYYYEKSSFALNVFLYPQLSNGVMNIPWFVSRGYMVFVPDINYQTGYPGRSALTVIVSAAKYLSRLSWIDSKHIGLQGHSFGGFETNYIVTHSSLFAAAAPSDGLSNTVSDAYYNNSRMSWYVDGQQGRIGALLWERPDLYVENSAAFKVDKVTTPLLILHNRRDLVSEFDQGIDWYNYLKYLGKKAWLLSYNSEGHVIEKKENQLDYTIRLQQFFDYYLKGASPPKWMTTGNSNTDHKAMYGYELDTSGTKP